MNSAIKIVLIWYITIDNTNVRAYVNSFGEHSFNGNLYCCNMLNFNRTNYPHSCLLHLLHNIKKWPDLRNITYLRLRNKHALSYMVAPYFQWNRQSKISNYFSFLRHRQKRFSVALQFDVSHVSSFIYESLSCVAPLCLYLVGSLRSTRKFQVSSDWKQLLIVYFKLFWTFTVNTYSSYQQ